MNDFEKYLYYKLIQSIINNEDVLKELKNFDKIILDRDFIIVLGVFIDEYVKTNKLDKDQLYNILELVNYIRLKTPKEMYNQLLNKMIISINNSDSSNKTDYYIDNCLIRFYGHGILKHILPTYKVPNTIKKIKESISKDYFYLVILTLSEEEDFYKEINKFVLDEYFLLSINQIVYEYYDIVENATFLKRLKEITKANLENINSIEDEEKRKIIRKKSKYYFKHIKEE